MKYLSLVYIAIFLSCIQISNFNKQIKSYKKYSYKERSESLWYHSNNPWAWNRSYDRITVLLSLGADTEWRDSSKTLKTTAFLNASGALECLRFIDKRRDTEIDSMEMEAVKIVKYLAAHGANINAVSGYDNQNALHFAARGGRDKMVPVLVELGLDINQKDSTIINSTPLVLGILAGDLPTVKAIVEAGAYVNLCTARGNSPLDWADGCASGCSDSYPYHDQKAIVEYLLLNGAKHGKNNFNNWMQF